VTTDVQGIMLAAGLSTRLGRPKLTVNVAGIPVISRVTRAALDSQLSHVILVTGVSNSGLLEAIGEMVLDSRLVVATNPHPELGMSSSVRTGMRMLEKDASGAMLILADQPFLTSSVIDRLLAGFDTDPDRIVVALIRGRRSNPVIFPVALFGELEEIHGDVGGRYVLRQHENIVVGIEMGDQYDDEDLDTTEDLQRILRKAYDQKNS
jgi:molybdenum cofactor cytidylyltransferase